MVVDELISLAGQIALLLIGAGVVIAIVRARRRGASVEQMRAGRIAVVGTVVVLLLVAGVILVFSALAETDGRFRF